MVEMVGMNFLATGLGSYDLAALLLRVVPGVFFLLFRFRWLYDPHETEPWFCPWRRQKLVTRLCSCGFGTSPTLAGMVALVEIAGGAALIVGFLTLPAALGILVVMGFANCCEPPEELRKMAPVDKVDWVAKFLLFCEPLYFVMMLCVLLLGPGRWSLDWLLFGG